jgi:hypothetical protein
MAKKKPPKPTCVVEGCHVPAKEGLKVCHDHADPLRLQGEVERLRSTRGHGLTDLLARFPAARNLLEHLAVFTDRASTGVKQDEGRLGAAVAAIAGTRKKLDQLLDPTEDRIHDPRPRCRRRECDGRGVPQPTGVTVCGFCGWHWTAEGEQVEAPASAERSQESLESPTTVSTAHEVAEPAERGSEGPAIAAAAGVHHDTIAEDISGVGNPTPERVTGRDGRSYPKSRAQSNGNGGGSRSIVVVAPSMHQAAKKGLQDARAMFSSLDVRSVLNVEHLEEGSKPDRARWKVTLLTG